MLRFFKFDSRLGPKLRLLIAVKLFKPPARLDPGSCLSDSPGLMIKFCSASAGVVLMRVMISDSEATMTCLVTELRTRMSRRPSPACHHRVKPNRPAASPAAAVRADDS